MGLIAEGVYLGSEINSGGAFENYRCSHKLYAFGQGAFDGSAGPGNILTIATATLTNFLINQEDMSSFYFKYLFFGGNLDSNLQIIEVSHVIDDTHLATKTPFIGSSAGTDTFGAMQSFGIAAIPSSVAELSKPIKKAIVKAADPAPGAGLTIVTNGNIQQDAGLIYDFPYVIENPGGIVPFAISDASNFNFITQY